METNQDNKLGAGILTVSIIQLVFSVLGILGLISMFAFKDTYNAQLEAVGEKTLTSSEITISLIMTIILIIALVFILMKKAMGVYVYFTINIISIIYTIIIQGFSATIILSFILPALMAYLIYKKKYIFGFDTKAE